MNTPDMVKQYKPSVQAPSKQNAFNLRLDFFFSLFQSFSDYLDLVIVKLNNAHYRGQIVDYDETDYVVYFLDYGYTEQMSRESIYQWFPRWDIVPGKVIKYIFSVFFFVLYCNRYKQCNLLLYSSSTSMLFRKCTNASRKW